MNSIGKVGWQLHNTVVSSAKILKTYARRSEANFDFNSLNYEGFLLERELIKKTFRQIKFSSNFLNTPKNFKKNKQLQLIE